MLPLTSSTLRRDSCLACWAPAAVRRSPRCSVEPRTAALRQWRGRWSKAANPRPGAPAWPAPVQFAQPPHFLCVVGFQLFQLVGQGLHVGASSGVGGTAGGASAASANGVILIRGVHVRALWSVSMPGPATGLAPCRFNAIAYVLAQRRLPPTALRTSSSRSWLLAIWPSPVRAMPGRRRAIGSTAAPAPGHQPAAGVPGCLPARPSRRRRPAAR